VERDGGPPTLIPILYMLLSIFKALCEYFQIVVEMYGIIIETAETARSSEDMLCSFITLRWGIGTFPKNQIENLKVLTPMRCKARDRLHLLGLS
jgi:hypothetical protein